MTSQLPMWLRSMKGPYGEEDGPGSQVAYSSFGSIARHTIATIETTSPDQATTRAIRRSPCRANVSRQIQNMASRKIVTTAAFRVAGGSRDSDRCGSLSNLM